MKNNKYLSKIIIFFFVMLTFNFCASIKASAEDNEIKCFLDGKQLHFDVLPIVKEGVTYVPMRAIFEAQGAVIEWNNTAKTISAVRGDIHVFYMVKEGKVFVNGQENEQVLKAISFQNNTLVPLRFISEVLGSNVSWDEGTHSVHITSSVAEAKIVPPVNRTITLGSQEVSKTLTDERNRFEIRVKHYGIKNNQLYSLIEFSNMDNKEISINFKSGDKKIIRTISKEKDPMPIQNIENCTQVTNKVVIDNIAGKVYNLPEFSINQVCVSSNQSQQNAYEEWKNNNSGFSVVGSNTVSVRRYVQDQAGGLQNFVIPANSIEQLILVAPVGGENRLVVEGSYFVGGLINKTIEFKLDYEVVSELDLGIYSFVYTQPVY
ncbi:copper amine oxidase N-terminal domain-containing protein [Paenibacillus sp. FSL R10-2734]|uniref:copper amine oxidase N-terminal domain-containing protein n=1 Tax=Paenibacillus sp. FSL R10-2734 TaxID=2954691 RepID=UPI0030DDC278